MAANVTACWVTSAVLAAAAVSNTAAVAPVQVPQGGWRTAALVDHPLVGRIWDARKEQFVDWEELVVRLLPARVVLLGEKHDNPDHHALQTEVLAALVASGRHPAVAFEQFDGDQAVALAAFLAQGPADATGLGDAVGWRETGWPDWAMYQPIADIAVRNSLPVLAANLPARVARLLSRGGLAAAAPEDVDGLDLSSPLDPEVEAAMRQEIMDSHCGMAAESMMAPMVLVQRARDAHMAKVTAAGAMAADGAVLIAGFGHTRKDRAVPAYLGESLGPVASLAFLEVVADRLDPAAYGVHDEAGGPFDLVWFTPRVDDEDPCEKFRDRLQRVRERAAGAGGDPAPTQPGVPPAET